uniref:Uncharacterized protein n=1 Tax=Nothobranchius furzeri TaxID=105023 RepID=A0A8C6PP78_NOTFU
LAATTLAPLESVFVYVWIKLQGLPQASPLEQGAFAVVILFVGEFCLNPLQAGVADLQQLKPTYLATPQTCFMSIF